MPEPLADARKWADKVVHFTEYLKSAEEASSPAFPLTSGFKEFDAKLGDLHTGEVTVISGKTGEGKTLFAESWMRGMMLNSDAVSCVFSYEVMPKVMLQKYKNNSALPLYLPMELKTMDVDWLKAKVQEAKLWYGCRVFLFDHLHFLIDMSTKQNMSLNIGGFMRRMKQEIAIGLDVAVIIIAHQKGVPRGEEPSLEDMRDSSFIAQEADNVVMVWRRPDFKEMEIGEIRQYNPTLAAEIDRRSPGFNDAQNLYSRQFEMVQIAKARRSGTYRWKKLFQKVGDYFEEV